MAVLDFPSSIGINNMEFGLQSRSQSFTSELTGVSQTASLPGDRWAGVMTFTNKTGAEARALMGFLASLKGKSGRFRISLPNKVTARTGNATSIAGPIVVNSDGTVTFQGCRGAGYISADCTTVTADSSSRPDDFLFVITKALAAGDFITVNDELKIVTTDADSDINGNVTVGISPMVRNSAGSTVSLSATCVMQLADDSQARWTVQPLPIYAMSVSFIEAIDI